MNITYFIIGVVFIVLGLLVRKYPILLAGYNTMSKEKKANVDEKGLTKYMCNWLVCIGAAVIVLYIVLDYFEYTDYLDVIILSILLVAFFIMIIGAQRYDHNKKGKFYWAFYLIIAAIFLGIIFGICISTIPADVSVSERNISLSGIKKTEISISDIKEISIINEIPKINKKVNGFALGNVHTGIFQLDDFGICHLSLYSLNGPYLMIKTYNPDVYVFNYKDSSKVNSLYDEIIAAQSRGYIVNVGDTVPSFSLELLDGTEIPIEDLRGKIVMLQFTASWCSVCRKEMPHIESEIWLKYKDNPSFALYGIDLKETSEKITDFAAAIPVSYPITLDSDGLLFELFCTKNAGVTRNIIIDRSGKIIMLTRLYNENEFSSMVNLIDEQLNLD